MSRIHPARASDRAGARLRTWSCVVFVAASVAPTLLLGCAGDGAPRGEHDLVREGLPPNVTASIEVVDELHAAMIGIMEIGPELGYAGRYAAIAEVVRASFDIPAMARASYGPGFTSLTDDQKRTWLAIFERFHISALADVRAQYRGQTYRILGYSVPASGIVVIESKLDYPDRNVDLYTDYRLRRTRLGWRIVDLHGPPSVSEVAMRRAEYRTVIDRHGFDGLIEEMEARIARRERP